MERLDPAAPEWTRASVLLIELRERGYGGGYMMLKQFVASPRPKQVVEPVIRFETKPGKQVQVDWRSFIAAAIGCETAAGAGVQLQETLTRGQIPPQPRAT